MEIAEASSNKLYKISGMVVATYFGSFLATGYLLYKNYQALGETTKAKAAALLTAPTTLLMVLLESLVPPDFISRQIVVLPQVAGTLIALRAIHSHALIAHKEAGLGFMSNWRALAVGMLPCIIFAAAAYTYGAIAGNA